MGALVTVLTEFADNGDSRTFTTSGHTVVKPKIVIQKRKVPLGAQSVAEISVAVVHGTEDSAAAVLPQKVSMGVTVRYPVDGIAADRTAALAILQDIVQSTEFAAAIESQNWLK